MIFLLLEDNMDFATSLVDLIRLNEHEVDHTTSVDESIKMFDRKNYDVIITDFHLYDEKSRRSSGIDLIFHARFKRKSNIIIVMTTGLESVKESEAKDLGVDLFFHKPISIGMVNFINIIYSLVKKN